MDENQARKMLEFLAKQDWPVTTETVASILSVSWNTAQVQLLKLVAEGKVRYKRVGRQNQFWINRLYKKNMG
jgi:predicted ArsR family transcriptional regulator